MAALPKGAALTTVPLPVAGPRLGHQRMARAGSGARCAATPIGPTPGPPPPCGMQKVLCRLRWQTSAPMLAGLVSPTCAFMLAPSM